MSQIKSNSTVIMHYEISVPENGVFDQSFDEEPLQFTLGQGLLDPLMEQALIGLKEGDQKTFSFKAGKAYGQPDSENIVMMPIEDFSDELTFAEGHVLEFEMPDGSPVPGTILEITTDAITVDFNHPLAGFPIDFKVEILSVN